MHTGFWEHGKKRVKREKTALQDEVKILCFASPEQEYFEIWKITFSLKLN